MAKDVGRSAERESKDAKRVEKRLRRHLKRLRDELASASKAESKRLRKLEQARWRRQRIQAFIDEVESIATAEGNPKQDEATKPAATARSSGRPKPAPLARATAGPAARPASRTTAKPAPRAGARPTPGADRRPGT